MHFARASHHPAKAAAFFAMDPDTGRVLAVGSVPTYDPSLFVTPPSTRAYNAVLNSGALNNLATDGLFPTGSTFKPITALAGLQSGQDHRADAPGRRLVPADHDRERSATPGHNDYGDVDLVNALEVSVDTYFYKLGAELNCATCSDGAIQNEARLLGLGEHPGIDLPGGGAAGLVPDGPADEAAQPADHRHGLPQRAPRRVAARSSPAIRRSSPPALRATTSIRGRSARTSASRPARAISRRRRCRWRSPTPRSSTAARSGSRRSPRRSARRRGALRADAGAAARSAATCRIDPYYRQLVMDGLHAAAQSPSGTSYAVFGNFPRTVYGKTGTAVHNGQADQSWYVCYVPDGGARS